MAPTPEELDLAAWGNPFGLKRATTGALKTAELETVLALKGMTPDDVADLNLSAGQTRVLKLALEDLGNPHFKANPPAVEKPLPNAEGEETTSLDKPR